MGINRKFFLFSDEMPDFDEMTAMDQIIEVNSSKFTPTGIDLDFFCFVFWTRMNLLFAH